MHEAIKEGDIPETEVRRYTEALLVRPGERDRGVLVWKLPIMAGFYSASVPAKVREGRTLLVEVEDPDDAETAARVLAALTERARS